MLQVTSILVFKKNTLVCVDWNFYWVLNLISLMSHLWDTKLNMTREISYLQANNFWQLSNDFLRFAKSYLKPDKHFQTFSKNFWRLLKMFHSYSNTFKYRLRDLLCNHSNGDLFTYENNMIFLCLKTSGHVFVGKLTWYFAGVYIIKILLLTKISSLGRAKDYMLYHNGNTL